jgi:YHS domain-containing protein
MERNVTATKIHVDPVCGMEVMPGKTDIVFEHAGCTYFFCAKACREAFETNPQKYLKPGVKKRKGLWGRYLERLTRATGGQPPKCH